jgi:translation initiation factor IF-3
LAKAFNRGPRPPFRGAVKEPENKINEFIRVPEVRLVGENLAEISAKVGEEIATGIFPTRKVLIWAEKMELDLVEINGNAAPPIVRIVDYTKFLYQKKKKEKELKDNTHKIEVKEIRFGPSTEKHDFEFKLRHAQKFLEDGDKVKAYVQFKGREIVFKDKGELLLLNFLKELVDLGSPEATPKLEGKRMFVMITPKKKKG